MNCCTGNCNQGRACPVRAIRRFERSIDRMLLSNCLRALWRREWQLARMWWRTWRASAGPAPF